MYWVPLSWSFERNRLFNAIEAVGTTSEVMGVYFLLRTAINIIEKSQSEFSGFPLEDNLAHPDPSLYSVSFTLIFPTEQATIRFMEFLQSQKHFFN